MKSKNIDYLPGVDHLRGFAALLIVAYHGVTVITYKLAYGDPFTFDHWGDADNPLTALVLEGHTAVALFMVLSGFIFAYGSYGKDVQYKDFIINRFVRTYPLFLVILFLGMAARPEGVTLDGVLQSVLFLANTRAAVDLTPYTSMFWAVAVEWQFYLIFPFLLAFLNQRGVRPLLLLLVALILLRTLATALGASPRDISYWTIIGRMDQFLLGMLGGAAFQRGLIGGGRAMALVAGSGALVLAYAAALNAAGGWPRDVWWKVLAPTAEGALWVCFILGYVALAGRWPRAASRPGEAIGAISYSIYLTHFLVIHAVMQHGLYALPPGADAYRNALATTAFIVTPATLVIAAITFAAIEKPFLDLRRAYHRR